MTRGTGDVLSKMSVLVVALTVSLLVPGTATADFVGNQLIVGFKKGTSASEQKRIVRRASGITRKRFRAIRASVVRPRPGVGLKGLRKRLRRSRKGIWYTKRDVPPERFRRVLDFIEVAGQAAAA